MLHLWYHLAALTPQLVSLRLHTDPPHLFNWVAVFLRSHLNPLLSAPSPCLCPGLLSFSRATKSRSVERSPSNLHLIPLQSPPLPKSLSIELSTPLTEPLDLTTGYIAPVLFQILVPKLRAKPVRTASGIAVVAVMCKPHRNSDVVHYIAKNHSFVYSCSEAVFASAPAPGVKSGISKFLLNAFQAE